MRNEKNIAPGGSPVTGAQRYEFMCKLATEVHKPNGLILGEWEQNFLASWRRSSSQTTWFIGERPKFVDRMWMKYGGEVGMPFANRDSLNRGSEKIPDAEPDGCEFLVMDEARRQSPCNGPAVKVRRGGFRYCETHADEVVRHAKRRGMTVTLFDFKPKAEVAG